MLRSHGFCIAATDVLTYRAVLQKDRRSCSSHVTSRTCYLEHAFYITLLSVGHSRLTCAEGSGTRSARARPTHRSRSINDESDLTAFSLAQPERDNFYCRIVTTRVLSRLRESAGFPRVFSPRENLACRESNESKRYHSIDHAVLSRMGCRLLRLSSQPIFLHSTNKTLQHKF